MIDYPCEAELLVDLGQLAQLVPQDMAGLVPLRPEQKHHTLVRIGFLYFIQLLEGFDFDYLVEVCCRWLVCEHGYHY